ncbi:diaminopimelate decarboxylase [Actinomadura monticuli]|uniref:Diaminopimelate decarboxylase n=1 Tax=Actinomadura monticuli TaxID=3097367 RepID=A0ABV4Q5R0_9ACTN
MRAAPALVPGPWPATARRDVQGVLLLGGVPVTALAERFGTPAYIVDESEFRARCAMFARAFDGFDIYYAGKSFLCKAIARIVAEAGLRLDVCGGGELAVALAAGFPPNRIVLHGNNKSAAELTRALTSGVGRIVIDSENEIELLSAIARRLGVRATVLLRVVAGVRTDTHPHNATGHEDQKFGLGRSAAGPAIARIRADDRFELAGLHTHLGSQIRTPAAYEAALTRLLDLRARAAPACPEINLGGGFAMAYTEPDTGIDLEDLARELQARADAHSRTRGLTVPRLAIEPGRSIAGPAGCTLYRVGTVKERPGLRTYVAVDGGLSDNIRPALLGADYTAALAGRCSTARGIRVRVVGRHCDAGDILVREGTLPADVRPGDLLAVPGTGAYCRSFSSNFNHSPRPPVVGVRSGRARVLVRGETEEDLLRLDLG